MFIDVEFKKDPILEAILKEVDGEFLPDQRLGRGCYLSTHWNSVDLLLGKWEKYSNLEIDGKKVGLGVCDSPGQFIEKLGKVLESSPESFCVFFVKISRDIQPSKDGWRWHKWGEYIGNQTPTCEYLYDEPEIKEIYTYHICKLISTKP